MMGRVTISSNCGEDSTYVSNIFIDEYMQDANDAQIKIYLFLLRMMSANLPTSVEALADKFNHTESDVIRALKYWEKKGLISLEYDTSQNLTGIHMEDIVASQHRRYGRRRGDSVQNPVAPPKAVKKEATDVSNLLFIAEQYFGRTLTSTEMQTICYIHDDLAFSDDLLDYLMQYCVDNHKKDFRYMEKVAINWNQQGIKTPKQARAEIFKHDSDFIAIMKALGMENSPTEKETNFILKWRGELGFSMDIILEACDRTVMATQKGRLKYCDAILRSWHEKKVKTREDIAKLDANFTADLAKKRSKASISSIDTKLRLSESSIRSGVSQNRFNQFQQNTYDFAELEKKLLDN
ncbi:DnaD domain protein [Butyrivibrio sp. VCB2001]|uniref:DnaD domain protein n=1 Tax=Butyrivibrio sp. VCB2001 TaxID=1280667 RepID=UPI000407205F|nr:DnaD domain protein [Butyrivibrio sp. VCB2001]